MEGMEDKIEDLMKEEETGKDMVTVGEEIPMVVVADGNAKLKELIVCN